MEFNTDLINVNLSPIKRFRAFHLDNKNLNISRMLFKLLKSKTLHPVENQDKSPQGYQPYSVT